MYPLSTPNLKDRLNRVVPQEWKRANITPVFKFDNKTSVENYRWISLLSIPSKCQEKIINHAIFSHVAPYLNGSQHGFVKGRSCVTQLVLTHRYWSKALDAGYQVDALFLDFSKACDIFSKVIQHPCDQKSFQDDLNNSVFLSRLNHNHELQYKLMRITKKCSPILFPLQLDGTTLEVTPEFSDLGLLTNHKLSWNSHIDNISSKANKCLAW